MTKIMNAKDLETWAEHILTTSIPKSNKGRNPKLNIVVASDDKASERYVANKVKMGEKFNIDVEVIKFDENVTNKQLEDYMKEMNNDDSVDGVILQLPVYKHLNAKHIINQLCPYKDVDGLTWYSKAKLEENNALFDPCTPMGVISLLELEGVEIKGKNVVVVGRGETSGAPMATMFRNYNATVTVCHSGTKPEDLEFYVRHADIVVSCVGKRNLLDAEWFKEDSIVIGVGFSYDENGKQQLDFDVDKVVEIGKAAMVSQRTNCTGKMTVISLLCNTVLAYLREM